MPVRGRRCHNNVCLSKGVVVISRFTETAWAEIDLDALQHNARLVRSLAPRSRIMAMLKADAYGHGLIPCARALRDLVDGMAVARLDEAEKLRQVYPDQLILLTASMLDAEALRWCAEKRIAIIVHEDTVLRAVLAMDVAPAVWLKLNTGMNRLGFGEAQFLDTLDRLRKKGIDPVTMTHFACADEPEAGVTEEQIRAFDAAVSQRPLAHQSLSNSAGLVAFPQAHRDWVRPGLMLYGANPFADRNIPGLRPVMSLKAKVLAINSVRAGDRVGYGGIWSAPEDGFLATVGIGYGDGYPRQPGADAQVLIGGRLYPVAGRVSMDLLSVYLGRRPEPLVGDEALLWGQGRSVEAVAATGGVINYELLCRIKGRVTRRYYSL